jgi:hypothetical protein
MLITASSYLLMTFIRVSITRGVTTLPSIARRTTRVARGGTSNILKGATTTTDHDNNYGKTGGSDMGRTTTSVR